MSLNVLVIPENPRTDQYVVGPLVRAVLHACGKPNANVRVLTDPVLGGVTEALKIDNLVDIVDRYPLVQLFVLVVDRDGDEHRRTVLDQREEDVRKKLRPGQGFFAVEAWQEIEVWVLAGQDLPGVTWAEVRAERDPKERYFLPFATEASLTTALGGGLKQLGEESARKYGRVKKLCPELAALEQRVADWLRG